MSGQEFSDERLREALAEVAGASGDGTDCPPPERLWLSGRGELAPAENDAVVLHVARCPSCGMALRIAHDLAPEPAAARRRVARRLPGPRGWMGLAAAAILIAAAGAGIRYLPHLVGEPAPAYRTQESEPLQSMLDDGAALPRDDFVLRWAAGPEGTLYEVQVATETLDPLARKIGLRTNEFRVPPPALERLPPGARIIWQVTASLPDGRTLESVLFINEVE